MNTVNYALSQLTPLQKISFLFIFLPKVLVAQVCVIYDKDGYTNVRSKASINSNIIGKIKEGQAFSISTYKQDEQNKSTDWVAVNFPAKSTLEKGGFVKYDNREKSGFIHKSRLIPLENLPVFNANKITEAKIIHSYKSLSVIIETQPFKKPDHKIVQDKKGHYKIDNKPVSFYYGGEATEIKQITIQSESKRYTLPKIAIRNLFMVEASRTNVPIGKKGEYYIIFDAGDGADAYNIIYCIRNMRLTAMVTTSTID